MSCCCIELQYQLFVDIDGIYSIGRVVDLKVIYIVVPIFLIIHIVLDLDMAEPFHNDVRYNTTEMAIGDGDDDMVSFGYGDRIADQRFELIS